MHKTILVSLLAMLWMLPATSAQETGWFTEPSGTAHMPVLAGFAVVQSNDPILQLQGHTNMRIEAWLNDTLLFETDSVHEHDGLHTLAITPPGPGNLRLIAYPNDATDPITTTLPIHAAATDHDPTNLNLEQDGPHIRLTGLEFGDALILFDARDLQGRLVASHWSHLPSYWMVPATPGISVRAIVSTPNQFQILEIPELNLDALGMVIASGGPCPFSHLVTDPESPTTPKTWNVWSDIRLSYLRPLSELEPIPTLSTTGPAGRPPTGHALVVLPAGPVPHFTFRQPEPGTYKLSMSVNLQECLEPFTLTPGTQSPPGTLDMQVATEDHAATLTMKSLAADGSTLGHYEFDTRVLQDQDEQNPGRIIWQGKLHGHGGEATATFHNLEPGNYTVHVYPSPQSIGEPPLATDNPDGFVVHFTVPEDSLQDDGTSTAKDTPAPGTLTVIMAILGIALFVLRRRH